MHVTKSFQSCHYVALLHKHDTGSAETKLIDKIDEVAFFLFLVEENIGHPSRLNPLSYPIFSHLKQENSYRVRVSY